MVVGASPADSKRAAASREPLLDMKSMTMKRPARCGSVLELPAREALADEPTVGGVNASPAAKGARLSAVAPIVVVVVVAVMARLLLLLGAGTRCSGGGRRWA
jgi:hypothetical protein